MASRPVMHACGDVLNEVLTFAVAFWGGLLGVCSGGESAVAGPEFGMSSVSGEGGRWKES